MDYIVPKRLPEANIQAEIYHQCRLLGINCILEYKVPRSRFDICIIKDDKIVLIIETKSHKINHQTLVPPINKQMKKYQWWKVPILYCGHMEQVQEVIDKIKKATGV